MKKVLFLFISICFSFALNSQSPVYQWAKSVGFASGGPEVTQDGSFIRSDASGNVVIAGNFSGTMDFDPSPSRNTLTCFGYTDIFVAKYNSTNALLWSLKIGNTLDDNIGGMETDTAGNIYVAGYFRDSVDFDPSAATATLNSGGHRDIYIAKYSSNGNLVWAKQLHNLSQGALNNGVNNLKLDKSGNIYVTGYFQGVADFDPSGTVVSLTATAIFDDFVAKYDNSGNLLWAKSFGFQNSNNSTEALEVLASGDLIVGGNFTGTEDLDPSSGTFSLTSAGGSDIFFVKLNTAGGFIWAKKFGASTGESVKNITSDANGNFVSVGAVSQWAGLIAKHDINGNLIWSRTNIGIGTSQTQCNAVILDQNDDIFVTGFFEGKGDFDPSSSAATLTCVGGRDIFMAKYSAGGNYIWANSAGNGNPEEGYDLTLNINTGNILFSGIYSCLVDFNPSAAVDTLSGGGIFVVGFNPTTGSFGSAFSTDGAAGGYDAGQSIALDHNKNIVVAGEFTGKVDVDPSAAYLFRTSTGTTCYSTERDIMVSKFDDSGNLIWNIVLGGPGPEDIQKVTTDSTGNIYIAGNFSGTMDFDPSFAVFALTSYTNNSDIFIAKYDPAGNFIWARNMGGPLYSYLTAMEIGKGGKIYITGALQGTMDFDPSQAAVNITSAGGVDIFIACYSPAGSYLFAKKIGATGNDYSSSIAIDKLANIYISGSYMSTCDFDPSIATSVLTDQNGNGEGFIAKYDANGNFIWAYNFTGPGTEGGQNLVIDAAGDVLLQGSYQYTNTFNSQTNTVVLVNPHTFYWVTFIAKYTAGGNLLFVKDLGRCTMERGSIGVDSLNNIILGGGFSVINDFDPSTLVANLTPTGYNDMFIAKYSSSGNFKSADRIGGNGGIFAQGLQVDGSDNLYLTGGYTRRVDFDPSGTVASFVAYPSSLNEYDMFIVKYNSCNFAAALNGSVAGKAEYCSGSSATFSIAPVYGATSYNWSSPSGWSGSSQNNSITLLAGNAGNITVSAVNPCGISNAVTLSVTTYSTPATATITTSAIVLCLGETFSLSAGGSTGIYNWSGPQLASTLGPTVAITANSINQTGVYQVVNSLTVNSLTCTGIPAQISIVVDPCTNVTENESECSGVVLMPNPGSGIFYLDGGNCLSNGEITIFSSQGSLLQSFQITGKCRIDLTEYARGIYYARVLYGNSTKTFKIVRD